MSNYLNRSALLSLLADTHEKTITIGGASLLIREVTARARLLANEAALAENPDKADQVVFDSHIIRYAVVDPESGTAGPDGRIDPRTRRPLLTLEDVETLCDGRSVVRAELLNAIWSLGSASQAATFRGDPAADGAERDAGAGAETGGAGVDGDAAA